MLLSVRMTPWVGITLLLTPPLGAQQPLDSLARAYSYALSTDRSALEGPGLELLLAGTADAQFVAVGEQHNTRAIPRFTTVLFAMLNHVNGFRYLAVEEGPLIGTMVDRAGRRGGTDSVLALAARYPNAFHMFTVEELTMLGEIARTSDASRDAIWGVNQEFGALHVYDYLRARATTAEAELIAAELADVAREYEGERFARNVHYLVGVATADELRRLRDAFDPQRGSEVDRILEQTELSRTIYAPYGMEPSPPGAAFYRANAAREENMKRLFSERYRAARAAGDSMPRVIVKSGHLHLYRGLSPRTQLSTLGNFLSEVATFHGTKSLHIYTVVNQDWVGEGWLQPFVAALTPDDATLFDLAALRPWAVREAPETLDSNVRTLILGYDVLIIFRDSAAGSLEGLRTPNFHWYPR